MTIKHLHPPFPDQEQYEQHLKHTLTLCMKKLNQTADPRTPSNRT